MPNRVKIKLPAPYVPSSEAELEEAGTFIAERVIEFVQGFPELEQGQLLQTFRLRLKQEGGIYFLACVSDVLPSSPKSSTELNRGSCPPHPEMAQK